MTRLSTLGVLAIGVSMLTYCFLAAQDQGNAEKMKALAKSLASRKVEEKADAAEALGKLGEEARPLARDLCRAMLDNSPLVKHKAGEALQKVHPKLYPHIATILEGTDTAANPKILERFKAREAISELGEEGIAAVPVIAKYVQENVAGIEAVSLKIGRPFTAKTEEEMVLTDIRTLTKIAPTDEATLRFLGELSLATSRPRICQTAVAALGESGVNHPSTRKLVSSLLVSHIGRGGAAGGTVGKALKGLEDEGKQTIPALRTLAQRSPDFKVRKAAEEALRNLERN